jgi:hypothetical protein
LRNTSFDQSQESLLRGQDSNSLGKIPSVVVGINTQISPKTSVGASFSSDPAGRSGAVSVERQITPNTSVGASVDSGPQGSSGAVGGKINY